MQNETPDFPTRLAACARQLRRHGCEAVCVADLAEAGRRLRDEIARCAPRSISYGDSMTLRATGIVEELRNGSRYEFIDGFDPALPRPEQLEVRRKGLLADFFMTGVNADNYMDYLGAYDASAVDVTPANILYRPAGN